MDEDVLRGDFVLDVGLAQFDCDLQFPFVLASDGMADFLDFSVCVNHYKRGFLVEQIAMHLRRESDVRTSGWVDRRAHRILVPNGGNDIVDGGDGPMLLGKRV